MPSNRKRRSNSSNSDKKLKRSKVNKCRNQIQTELPVYKYKSKLLSAIKSNQIIIVTGSTGCGKSTQIPQYVLNEIINDGKMACTEPRRVGAMSLAQRVSEEMNCKLGTKVGYSIRFENVCSNETKLVYMTDGVLLRELQEDSLLKKYNLIMIDEAHERTIQTDALFGILKKLLTKRSDLKLIISSATMDTEKFSDFFGTAHIFSIPGRLYEVQIKYCNPGDGDNDYIINTADRILNIHRKHKTGDILAFLPGQEEIDECCDMIMNRASEIDSKLNLYVLPAYSALPKRKLARIFEETPRHSRKVVVATNIAETSLTVLGVRFVVDCGLVKQKCYNELLGIDQLILSDVSKAQANQRAGRAGRDSEGYCYRLYSERRFMKKFKAETVPEIKRANLANTVLQLKSIGIENMRNFDFIDHPGSVKINEAVKELTDIGAMDAKEQLSKLGSLMAQFPLDPMLSKILIMSAYRECSEEMTTLVAMLCVPDVFERVRGPQSEVQHCRQSLNKSQGDHITLLNVYLTWRDNDYSRSWCEQHSVRHSCLSQAQSVRGQLGDILRQCGLQLVSCGTRISSVQDCLALYYFRRNAARREPGLGYRTLADGQLVHLHPGSALFERQPGWVVFHDIVVTSDKFMRCVTKIGAHMLQELVPRDLL